ncbi:MAG: 5-guanidino-2-oxopentanoate decarboxylase [Alphaproteobacteria bacterium]
MTKKRVGEALISLLEQRGVEVVFGIPGVHTVELYRGLAGSAIRHITPRHEQGAAFMADGYARVTGKPGVCFLITGPGFTNAITAIAQARADSVPMLVISGVNKRESLGRGLGHLHELPDQAALSRTVCLETFTLLEPERLGEVVESAFAAMTSGRPGPVHIEIPTDVMAMGTGAVLPARDAERVDLDLASVERAASMCRSTKNPLILAGGGVKEAAGLRALAEKLDAPVVTTSNGRGLMAGHPLNLPASPSLQAVRDMIAEADLLLALGTELGETDYDFFGIGPLPAHGNMIRVDIDGAQLARRDDRGLTVEADAAAFASALAARLPLRQGDGAERAERAKKAALAELPAAYRAHLALLDAIFRQMPEAIIVGDSTQAVYAGTLYLDAPAPGAWFHSATGYGTLGYAAPAAIGAAIGAPHRPVICLTGDGGLQFSLAELGSAADAGAGVLFLVWNNQGYREIENAMLEADVVPEGVRPSAPDFVKIAEAYGLPAMRVTEADRLADAVALAERPSLIEFFSP